MNKDIVQLIRERFHPVVRFCGPQHAGEVEVEGVRGRVYLGELSIWLFLAKSTHNGVLSDEELGDLVAPYLLARNLLLSAHRSMKGLLCHLDRIEAADGDTVSLLRYYLEDSARTVVDGMALGRILGPRGARQRNKLHVIPDYSWWKDISTENTWKHRRISVS
jgi:hypothetical protein